MDKVELLLKELTEAAGAPGYEAPVREVIRQYLQPLGALSQDKIGSLICHQTGAAPSPRVMLSAHMDEIAFMVKYISPDGFIRFHLLGGWFDQVLLAQRVVIKTRKGDVTGVIGVKPPHLLSLEEAGKVIHSKDMYVDIGATSQAEVEEAGVRIGDPILPRADFVPLASGKTYLAKAFDNRVGVAVMITALQTLVNQAHPNSIYAAATVMEEVGNCGAATCAEAIDPDVAIVLECDLAGDVPGVTPEEYPTRLGQGPTIFFYDGMLIPNLKLRDLLVDTAGEIGVPLQISGAHPADNDGSYIHLHRTGVPTVVLGVAARHIHSHSAILHRKDFDRAVSLLVAVLLRLDETRVAGLTI